MAIAIKTVLASVALGCGLCLLLSGGSAVLAAGCFCGAYTIMPSSDEWAGDED